MVGGEYQVRRIAPDANGLLLGVLKDPVIPQDVDEGLGQMQRAAAAGGLEIGKEDAQNGRVSRLFGDRRPSSPGRHTTLRRPCSAFAGNYAVTVPTIWTTR